MRFFRTAQFAAAPPLAADCNSLTFGASSAGCCPSAEDVPATACGQQTDGPKAAAYFISLSGFFLRNASHDDDPRAAFLPPPRPFTRSAPISVSMGVRAVK